MKILIVGCGPGGERWREIEHDRLIAVNSAITDCAQAADVFLCVENLGEHPERDHPWITTPTKPGSERLINEQTFRRVFVGADWGKSWVHPHFREETPTVYRDTSVGTALYHAVRFAEEMLGNVHQTRKPTCKTCVDHGQVYWDPEDPKGGAVVCDDCGGHQIHLIGFPLWFVDGVQHWTDTGDLYTPGASYWLPPIVFQSVNGMESTWAFIMAAAYFRQYKWRYPIMNHSGGLLDVPGIERLWKWHERLPFSCKVDAEGWSSVPPMGKTEVQRIIDSAPMERYHIPREHILENRNENDSD